MNAKHLALAGRIRAELPEIERVVQRAPRAWRRAQDSADDLYLDSTALNLHSFYAALERLFELATFWGLRTFWKPITTTPDHLALEWLEPLLSSQLFIDELPPTNSLPQRPKRAMKRSA